MSQSQWALSSFSHEILANPVSGGRNAIPMTANLRLEDEKPCLLSEPGSGSSTGKVKEPGSHHFNKIVQKLGSFTDGPMRHFTLLEEV
jgi:hypothetical protein